MKNLVVALFVGAISKTEAIKISNEWAPDSTPPLTAVTNGLFKGIGALATIIGGGMPNDDNTPTAARAHMQISEPNSMVQTEGPLYVPYAYGGAKGLTTALQHCPDFNDRFTLTDGKTRAVPYPQTGFNCRADYGLAQEQGKPAAETRYVPYAYAGAKGLSTDLQHCPDFNDRFTLTDGKTRGIPYPQKGFNCRADYGLAQEQGKPAAETRYVPYAYAGAKGLTTDLQHCPDFNDRFTLTDGKTRGIPYPQKGFNCRADYGLAQGKPAKETRYVPYAYGGAKGLTDALQHCPDFNDRFTLTDGKTRAVPYPQTGFNCRDQ